MFCVFSRIPLPTLLCCRFIVYGSFHRIGAIDVQGRIPIPPCWTLPSQKMQAMSSAASTVLLHQCSTTNRAFKVFLSLVNVLLFHVEPQKTAFRQCGVPDGRMWVSAARATGKQSTTGKRPSAWKNNPCFLCSCFVKHIFYAPMMIYTSSVIYFPDSLQRSVFFLVQF